MNLNSKKADLVGLQLNLLRLPAYEIADIYRKANIPVVLGGIHASMMLRKYEYVDTILIGEAEAPGLS